MTGDARFAKPRLSRPRAPAPAARPRRACARSSRCRSARRRRERLRPAPWPARPRRLLGAKAWWQGAIWLGWIRLLPSKPRPPPLLRFREEAVGILEVVEDAVERRDARRARRKHDHLQRGGNRLARRVERQAQVGAQVVGAGDQPGACFGDCRRRKHARRRLDHRQHRLCRPSRRRRATRCAEIARGTTTKSAFDRATASRSSECHSRADAVDRGSRRASASPRRPPPPPPCAPRSCPRASPHLRGRERPGPPPLRAPWRSRAGSMPAGTAATVRRTGPMLVVFRFRYGHGRRIMPRNRETGEELC